MGVFARIMTGLAAEAPDHKTISIDATFLKAHRTASGLRLKKGAWTSYRAKKGGMNTKLHAVTDTIGRPIRFFMIGGPGQRLHWGQSPGRKPASRRLVTGRSGL